MRKWLTLALIALQLAWLPAPSPFLNSTGQAFAASQPPDEDSDEQQDGEKSGPDLFDKLEIGAARLAGRVAKREAATVARQSLIRRLKQSAFAESKNGLSGAGRALRKKVTRGASAYNSPVEGTHAAFNEAGERTVNEILDNPETSIASNARGQVTATAPDGRFLRWNADGSFQGMFEPGR